MDIQVIETRLQKLDNYLHGLRPFQQVPRQEYVADENMQMIVERRLQLAIQVCLDVASYPVARLALRPPDEQENVFAVLGREGILPPALAQDMVGMARFRNILVHDYLSINPDLVHQHMSERLADFDAFSRAIVDRFLSPLSTPPTAS